jgi:hypothetical protein
MDDHMFTNKLDIIDKNQFIFNQNICIILRKENFVRIHYENGNTRNGKVFVVIRFIK